MASYYLDIETTGLDPRHSKIITIQYQRLERGTGLPAGPLTILKEWESGEEDMLEGFIARTPITDEDNKFSFIPVGTNLGFEHRFLSHKSRIYKMRPITIVLDRPKIDVHDMLVLLNNGEFKGSGLDKMTGKKTSGASIRTWYDNKEYGQIVEYIEDEAREFCRFYSWLCKKMPPLHREFMRSLGR